MQNLVPVARRARAGLPEFVPVPRKYRHDGWTPERQKAFIEALADTGSVSRAAAQVNMAQANCYTLRRSAGAEEFRRAWEAALDFGVQRLKDIAFERAIEGQLVPVFAAGKLMGFQRKRNDALLMFCLRHYGQDSEGRRTVVNYFSSRASAGAAAGEAGSGAGAAAEASATTIRTVLTGSGAGDRAVRDDALAGALGGFEGVQLDAEAQAAIATALEACAGRRRESLAAQDEGGEVAADAAEDDPEHDFVPLPPDGDPFRGELVMVPAFEEVQLFGGDEGHWMQAGDDMPAALALMRDGGDVAEVKRPKPRRRVGS